TKAIRVFTAGGDSALSDQQIKQNAHYILEYDSTANGGSGAWLLLNPSYTGRQRRTPGGLNLFVATTGSDSNDGRSVSTPFATIQKAINVALKDIDHGGGAQGISVADGTYAENLNISSATIGTTTIVIGGNDSTPGNVIIQAASGVIITVQDHAGLTLSGVRLQSSSGATTGIWCRQSAIVDYSAIEFGNMNGGTHILCNDNAVVSPTGNVAITGDAAKHVECA